MRGRAGRFPLQKAFKINTENIYAKLLQVRCEGEEGSVFACSLGAWGEYKCKDEQAKKFITIDSGEFLKLLPISDPVHRLLQQRGEPPVRPRPLRPGDLRAAGQDADILGQGKKKQMVKQTMI